jgi:hypothetical protein
MNKAHKGDGEEKGHGKKGHGKDRMLSLRA